MKVYTLNVGQGQFVVVTGSSEAFIVDTYVPINPKVEIVNVKAALAKILAGKNLVGLMITGFDADHFNEVGIRIVLNKYRPAWIMYPRYYKATGNARACFAAISEYQAGKDLAKYSIELSSNQTRFYYNICSEFYFEVFSPHQEDMDSSNNCSLVCKVVERSTGATYLITGDTETGRWDSITRIFNESLRTQLLAAPHHGSENGSTVALLEYCCPDTVIISAGVNNPYGHPDRCALDLFKAYSREYYSTNWGGGQSIEVTLDGLSVRSAKFSP